MKKFAKIFRLIAVSLVSAGILFSFGFAVKEQNETVCKKITIEIDDASGTYFIEKENVLKMMNSRVKQITGTPLNLINTAVLESTIRSNPFVYNAEVFSTIDGVLHVKVTQRKPVVRVINNKGEHFYIDTKGFFMPVSPSYTAPVIVANGNIFETLEVKHTQSAIASISDQPVSMPVIEQVYLVGMYLDENPLWNDMIEQVYVNENMEIELIPRVGDHSILMGDVTGLPEKFEKLMVFYLEGLSKTGWNKYNVINLKYKDQVVCTRK